MTEWDAGDVRVVPPERIRADKFTFNIILLKSIDRLVGYMPSAVEKDSKEGMIALRAAIDGLDFLVSVKGSKNYLVFREMIKHRLDEIELSMDDLIVRREYYRLLMRFLDEMKREFNKFGLMHAESSEIAMDMGDEYGIEVTQ